MGKLDNHVSIITGGSQGFGAGIVAKFVAEGARVLNIDLNPPQLGEGSDGAIFLKGDVAQAATWDAALGIVQQKGWVLSSVVNNAGWSHPAKPTLTVTEEEFDRVFNVNVKSLFFSTQIVVPYLQKQGKGGSFVTISSTAALRPRPFLVWYNATKGAISTASKAMAIEYAPGNIRFNCICPVAGNTPLLAQFAGGEATPEKLKVFIDSIPLGRLSMPRDIANAVAFLVSDEADFITGVDLEVDGGRCV